MKKHAISKLVFISSVFLFVGCTTKITDYQMVYDNTNLNLSELKRGQSCQTKSSFSGWTGDATVGAAAKNGSIKFVKHVSHEYTSNSACTIVYGK